MLASASEEKFSPSSDVSPLTYATPSYDAAVLNPATHHSSASSQQTNFSRPRSTQQYPHLYANALHEHPDVQQQK